MRPALEHKDKVMVLYKENEVFLITVGTIFKGEIIFPIREKFLKVTMGVSKEAAASGSRYKYIVLSNREQMIITKEVDDKRDSIYKYPHMFMNIVRLDSYGIKAAIEKYLKTINLK